MTDNLTRLGRYVTARRIELGYRFRIDFVRAVEGIADRTMSDIEHGNRKVGSGSYAILENALRWHPGTVERILEGGEPEVMGPQDPTPLELAPTEVLLAELRRRIVRPDTGEDDTWGGLDPGGDWPQDC